MSIEVKWKVFRAASAGSSKYAGYKDRRIVIVHPSGIVYFSNPAMDILKTGYVQPVQYGKLAGFRRSKAGEPDTFKITHKAGNLPVVNLVAFVKAAGLTNPDFILVWTFDIDQTGAVVVVDTEKEPIARLVYVRRASPKAQQAQVSLFK